MQEQINDTDVGDITDQQAKELGLEYSRLLVAENPSEQQEARIIEILELALTHKAVDHWVAHFTQKCGEETGLLSEDSKKNYEDQKALLKEHLGNPGLSTIRGKTQRPVEEKLNKQIKQHIVDTSFAATRPSEQKNNDQSVS